MSKSIRRDWLKRKVMAGKVVALSTYSFCDQLGAKELNEEIPVVFKNNEFQYGKINFSEHYFDSKSGYAKQNSEGVILFVVHSNLFFNLKILE